MSTVRASAAGTMRATLAAALILAACGDGSTGPSPVASVDVSPASLTLATGQTAALAGTPRAADGGALTDRQVTWSSDDEGIAAVSASGVVSGVAEGSTTLRATAENGSGTAQVTVLPAGVASVQVLPTQVSLLPGETAQLAATAMDAQGATLSGRTFVWVSEDVSVATVDDDGLVTSVAPGEATIFATLDGRSGGSLLTVDDPDAPRVLSVDPAVLVEGAPATLNGVNFSAVAAENVVTIDGAQATVTGATPTSLDIVVPGLACRPRHLADIAVTVGARTGRSRYPARPAASFQLAQGELALLRDPTAYCLHFDQLAGDEEYLIGIQSTASAASTVTSVLVASEADTTGAPAGVLIAPAPVAAPFAPRVGLAAPDAELVRELEWRSREAELMRREVEQARLLPRLAPAIRPLPSSPARIPGTVTEGTPVTLRYPELDSNDTCDQYVEIQGTVRYVGTSGIWVSDDANPAPGYTDDDYQALGDDFEQNIYPIQTDYFGAPADADGNGRIVVVVTKEVNADGIGGIVPSSNLFSSAQCAGSNEGEYFFMFAPDPEGEYDIGPVSVPAARGAAPTILGHELVHNIQLSRRFEADLPFWDSWMLEGQATLGEEILGHALTPPRGPGQNFGWSVLRNEPPDDAASRRWYYSAFVQLFLYYGWGGQGSPTTAGGEKRLNAPEGCTWLDTPSGTNAGVCANRGLLVYGVTWAFLRWLSDHYGPAFVEGEAEMHRTWIDGPVGGFASVEALVGEEMETLLANWAASLWLDDRVGGLDPLLTLPSYDLFDIESNVAPEARLTPRVRSFQTFSQSLLVRAGSSAYFLVSGADRPSTAIRARGPTGGFLSPTIQVWVVRVR